MVLKVREGNGLVLDPSGNRYRYTEAHRAVNAEDPFRTLNLAVTIKVQRVN